MSTCIYAARAQECWEPPPGGTRRQTTSGGTTEMGRKDTRPSFSPVKSCLYTSNTNTVIILIFLKHVCVF